MTTSIQKPRIMIIGYKDHGKDTAAEYLRKFFNLTFVSSSLFCAEHVVRPALAQQGIVYADVKTCFEDRVNHRSKWFDAICEFNKEDRSRLSCKIFEKYDIYCGLRNRDELVAAKRQNLFDLCLWIDASKRKPPEGKESCTVTPQDADVIIDNNGTLDEMFVQLRYAMFAHFPEYGNSIAGETVASWTKPRKRSLSI